MKAGGNQGCCHIWHHLVLLWRRFNRTWKPVSNFYVQLLSLVVIQVPNSRLWWFRPHNRKLCITPEVSGTYTGRNERKLWVTKMKFFGRKIQMKGSRTKETLKGGAWEKLLRVREREGRMKAWRNGMEVLEAKGKWKMGEFLDMRSLPISSLRSFPKMLAQDRKLSIVCIHCMPKYLKWQGGKALLSDRWESSRTFKNQGSYNRHT